MPDAAAVIIRQLKDGSVPIEAARGLLNHPAALVRVNAVEAVAQGAAADEALVEDLVAAAIDPKNGISLMGTITVAQVAVGCLIRVGTDKATTAARRLVDEWPEPERSDLLWYLQSQSLDLR